MAFYPLPANRRELLWELTSQVSGADNSIQGMKALVLADRTCEVTFCQLCQLPSFNAIKRALTTDSIVSC